MTKVKTPHSIFNKVEIYTLAEVFELYLPYQFDQDLVDQLFNSSCDFLRNKKDMPEELVVNFGFVVSFIGGDPTAIQISGINLLSALWLSNVYPPNPHELLTETEYNEGDFVYKFYTKNKNLSIKKTKKNAGKIKSIRSNRTDW